MKKYLILFIALLANTVQAQDDNNYANIGIGYQLNSIKNAYRDAGTLHSTNANGLNVTFALDEYEDGYWSKFDASGLLIAALAAVNVMKAPGPKMADSDNGVSSRYLLNDKLLHWQSAWAPGRQNLIGPTVQFGWEALGNFQINNANKKKGKNDNDAVGGGAFGLLSFGTGLNLFQPLQNVSNVDQSRFTLSADWFLKREHDSKFRISGRMRITAEASAILHRRWTATAYYSYFNFKKSFHYDNNATMDIENVNSVISTAGVKIAYNWLVW